VKILHIWNTAGVPSVIAKTMDQLYETESFVLTRRKFTSLHETYGKATTGGRRTFYLQLMYHILKDYDLYHVHDVDQRVPLIKSLSNKPLILHYHGSKIRGKWEKRIECWSKADRIIVSTEDLLEGAPIGTLHIPNPIDLETIAPFKEIPHNPGTALHTDVAQGTAQDLARKYADKYNLALSLHSRDDYPMPHREYLGLMGHHEYFIDIRRQYDNPEQIYKAPSQGVFEALAMGLKVIDHNGNIIKELPESHNPHRIVSQHYNLYLELVKR
jgi:glycosyltransferase involved in cell wall biosynthesis